MGLPKRSRAIIPRIKPITKEVVDAQLRRTAMAELGLRKRHGMLEAEKDYRYGRRVYGLSKSGILHER